MNNIIAASIIALGMIVSAAIIYFAPRPGRFQWKDDSLNENMIDVKLFDTARGLVYDDMILCKLGKREMQIKNMKDGSVKRISLGLSK